MSFIQVSDVYKSYGNTEVLRGISFNIEAGSQLAIQGMSGSGKSTLLYLLGGLDQAQKGIVKINGQNLSQLSDEQLANFRNKSVGFVFQFHFLLPSMTCLDNILLPAKLGGASLKEVKSRVQEFAETLGVTHCLKKYPFEISGGEQQRVNIIRATSLRPGILLCDEPTGNLDSKNSQKVVELLKDISSKLGTTLLVVTHDVKVADQFSQKITIEDGQIIS
jgi:lipoprotein-releasing system ATP-binding protein